MTTLYDTAGRAANVWDTSGALVFGDTGTTPTEPTPTDPTPTEPGGTTPPPQLGGVVLPRQGPWQETRPTSDGSGEMIHPSVVDMGENGWQGYRFWTVDTPYPRNDIALENPEILASNDGLTWEVPPGVTNPIAPYFGVGKFNSDPEMVWDDANKRMFAVWRWFDNPLIHYHHATSTDGRTWSVDTTTPILTLTENPWMSPTIAWDQGAGLWRMWVFGNNVPMGMYTSAELEGPWAWETSCTITGGFSVNWHGDIVRYRDHWIGAYSRKSGVTLMVSRDGISWAAGGDIGLSGYRPTISAVRAAQDGYVDVWTSADGTPKTSWHVRVHENAWWNLLAKLPA